MHRDEIEKKLSQAKDWGSIPQRKIVDLLQRHFPEELVRWLEPDELLKIGKVLEATYNEGYWNARKELLGK